MNLHLCAHLTYNSCMKALSPKSERLVARATAEEKTLIAHAAALRGRTITDFMVDAAQSAARKVVAEETVIQLSADNQRRLAEALLNPTSANDELQSAFAEYDGANVTSR